MRDLTVAGEQGRLVTIAGAALVHLAAGEHGGDKRVPPLVILALCHALTLFSEGCHAGLTLTQGQGSSIVAWAH